MHNGNLSYLYDLGNLSYLYDLGNMSYLICFTVI